MAKYSAIKAAVNAYIKANGRKEITGSILNAVLNATIDSLGKYFQFAGVATPTTDPENPDQNVCYLAGEPGTYTNFDNIVLENEEIALLFFDGTWSKQRMLLGIQEVIATVDNTVGTPSVDVDYSEGQLELDFHNIKGQKGDTGDAAGFGTIGATIDGNIGTPGVSVQESGPATAKNLVFNFTNLKGETGVTSVVATIDNGVGTPTCEVSLVGQQLTLAFHNLKGEQGNTGSSVDYPFEIVNNLTTNDSTKALSAAQGVALKGEVDQLEAEVGDLFEDTTSDYAIADENGNNLVEFSEGHIKTKNFDSRNVPGEEDLIPIENEEDADLSFSDEDENILCKLQNGHIRTKFFDSSKLPIKAIKKAVFMGDSITQGVYSYWNNGVHTDANRYNGFDISQMSSVEQSTAYHGIHYYFGLFSGAEMVNLGKRGTGWVADTRNIGNALVVATNYSFTNVDFVALFFGVNDYIQGVTIGTIGTPDTVRGNMASVIQKIASDNPLCKIVVYSPYNTFGQVSKGGDYTANYIYGDESTNYALGYDIQGKGTLSDYIAAIDDVCNYYGVQHIKLSASNVVNRLTIKNIMIDGLHPSKESYPMLAAEIYGKGNFGA